jgi:hypothetical protein
VVRLPRAAGAKESRYQHLLGGPAVAEPVQVEGAAAAGSPSSPAEIERAFAVLRAEISELRRQLADLQRRLN